MKPFFILNKYSSVCLFIIGCLLCFLFSVNSLKAEEDYKLYIISSEENSKLAVKYIRLAEEYFKSGEKIKACKMQIKASSYGIKANNLLIKAISQTDLSQNLRDLREGIKMWEKLASSCN
tara:strand:- start:2576 stop:2935 length:360 start_codon:yes stop_codon:yes gene_type:complete